MTTWTEPMIERLKDMHKAGATFGEIAVKISREFDEPMSRNAAIGKAGRLGLGSREPRSNVVVTRKPRLVSALMKPKTRVQFEAVESTDLPPDQSPCAVTFMQLKYHSCRWPIGEKPIMYCGETKGWGSYCRRHNEIAHTAPSRRGDGFTGSWRAA